MYIVHTCIHRYTQRVFLSSWWNWLAHHSYKPYSPAIKPNMNRLKSSEYVAFSYFSDYTQLFLSAHTVHKLSWVDTQAGRRQMKGNKFDNSHQSRKDWSDNSTVCKRKTTTQSSLQGRFCPEFTWAKALVYIGKLIRSTSNINTI